MKIILASTNKGKITEFQQICHETQRHDIILEALAENYINEPDEPHDTFLANAQHKAKYYSKCHNEASLSDDSGLCIHSLNDFPGVRTKEFVLECGDIITTYNKLAKMLQQQQDYSAHFICALALYLPKEDRFICNQARVDGTISLPPRGAQGFGFDPIFIPQGYTQTFAELGDSVKNVIGHRAKAMRGLLDKLM